MNLPIESRPVVVGLSGKMGAGKDSVATVLAPMLPHRLNTLKVAFATGLKSEIAQIASILESCKFCVDDAVPRIAQQMECGEDEALHIADTLFMDRLENGLTSFLLGHKTARRREALQYWGTDVRKASNSAYWIDLLDDDASKAVEAGDSVVVTDVRFPDEADYVRSRGGVLVRIEVPDEVRVDRLNQRDRPGRVPLPASFYTQGHSSETALDNYTFDFVVSNVTSSVMDPAVEIMGYIGSVRSS